MTMYYVYVLQLRDTSVVQCYVGCTDNIHQRIMHHIEGISAAKDTTQFGVGELLAVYRFYTREEALMYESYLHSIQRENPMWKPPEDTCSYMSLNIIKAYMLSRRAKLREVRQRKEIEARKDRLRFMD